MTVPTGAYEFAIEISLQGYCFFMTIQSIIWSYNKPGIPGKEETMILLVIIGIVFAVLFVIGFVFSILDPYDDGFADAFLDTLLIWSIFDCMNRRDDDIW